MFSSHTYSSSTTCNKYYLVVFGAIITLPSRTTLTSWMTLKSSVTQYTSSCYFLALFRIELYEHQRSVAIGPWQKK